MSNYNKIVTTLAGSNMLVESINQKKPLIFTRVALGDGTLLEHDNVELLTDLKHKICENGVESIKKKGNGEIDVVATISNANVSTGFYARELGVYAKVGEDGIEKLFAYTNAGAQASYTVAGTSLDEKLITITFYVGNAENVTINLNSQMYITKDNIEAIKSNIDGKVQAFTSDVESKIRAFKEEVHRTSVTAVTKADEGINVTKGGATELLKLFTSDKTDSNTALAPTLSVVKALIGDINVDVTSLLQSKGVRYDFSNENAWYICLGEAFGGLIIQGGKRTERNDDSVTFPIAFQHKVFGIQLTKGWGVNAASYKNATLTNFTMYSHDNRGYKTTWLAVGR